MIYFAQAVDGGPIKIGTSEDVDARLSQLETHYGRPLAVLATTEGGRDEEAAIHERFAHLRFGRTEQFRPTPELLAFIGRPLFVNAGDVELMEPVAGLTLVNLKGSEGERAYLRQLSRITGVPISEIVRRGIAMWATKRGSLLPPADWIAE